MAQTYRSRTLILRGVTLLEFALTLAVVGILLAAIAQIRLRMEDGSQTADDDARLAALRLASALDTTGRLPAPRNSVAQGSKLVGELDMGTFASWSREPLAYQVESMLVSGPLPRRYSPNKLGEAFGGSGSPSGAIAHVADEQRADLCITLEDMVRASFGKEGRDAAVAWVYPRNTPEARGQGWSAVDLYTFADCAAVLTDLNAKVDTWYAVQDHVRIAELFVRMAEMDTRAAKYNLANLSARLGIWSAAFLLGLGGTQEALSELHTSKLTGKAVFAAILSPSILATELYAYGIGLTIYLLSRAAPALKETEAAEQLTRDYLQRAQAELRTAEQALATAYTQGRTQ